MLYQEIRPAKLDQVRGNKAAIAALKAAVASNAKDRAHAFLFHGPSGCGKTTLARILAMEFGAVPNMSVFEYNAASSRGIDTIRELESYANIGVLGSGKARAVILDECHKLTSDAQNALLKILEDVPQHTYYFLCSTDPSKIIKTIHTRCQSVPVSKLSEEDMLLVLDDAVKASGLPDPGNDVMFAIADSADGSPRAALVMLEQQRGLTGEAAVAAVQKYSALSRTMLELCQAVVGGKWIQVLNCYSGLEDKDPEGARRAVMGYCKGCLVNAKGKEQEAERFVNMIEQLDHNTYDGGEPVLLAMLFRANKIK